MATIPTATYRLQLNKSFTFRDAAEVVPYLAELGISHCYSSPFFLAPPESTHGYDVCDHNQVNPVLGGEPAFEEFVETLHSNGMGQIVDFVPNHMGIARDLNGWWMDVLENGPVSLYAPFFDIDWAPVKEELKNKVLLPILGDQYGRVLENGELHVSFNGGVFQVSYYETKLPLAPRTCGWFLQRATEILSRYYQEDFFLELQSIMTALTYLPPRTEENAEKIQERAREKEIFKRRLERLCNECPQVQEALQQAVREIHGKKGDARSFDELDALLSAQPYRLSYWRVAAEEINYRRFFDINELAAIRMELPEVFDAAHRLLFELVKRGAVNGLRIDHVDGLWQPRDYFAKLQERHREVTGRREECGLYLVVEKILAHDERLRGDWAVHGTTGYEFTNQVLGVLVDQSAERPLTKFYEEFAPGVGRFADLVYWKKQEMMRLSMASEVNVLAHTLNRLSETNRWYRDFTLNALRTAVREVIACFPVYRTYVSADEPVTEADQAVIQRAVNTAKRRNPAIESSIFNFLRDILMMSFPENVDEAARAEHLQFVMKFQQCTGPIMAKGLEDTAFYIYNRLIALNEVGGEPQFFGVSLDRFHEQNASRARDFPHSMVTTSTHDTKRSEDVRARIAAISEVPELWREAVTSWREMSAGLKTEVDGVFAPDDNEEYLLYQILVGSWPNIGGQKLRSLKELPGEEYEVYVSRIQDYMTKAIKEAKQNSSWVQPNEEWDEAVRKFVAGALDRSAQFVEKLEPVAAELSWLGMRNALAQTVLKLTVPGVPDIYQGCELWDLSLVDPDNRRPVDYGQRREFLREVAGDVDPALLLETWADGRIKLFITHRLLHARQERVELFNNGTYRPLQVTGTHADSCVAFVREHQGEAVVVICSRLTARLGENMDWQDTEVELPGSSLSDCFTGKAASGGRTPVAELLSKLPVAVLLSVKD